MEICRLENIKKTYHTYEKVTPLEDISLSINTGDFICIEGPSGIGKSTLLYIIGGLLNVSSGNVFIDGNNTISMEDKVLTTIRRDKIGFIFQESNLIQALTIEENMMFMQSMSKNKKDIHKINELLTRLGLFERKDFLPSELSGGQRRRAMIGTAIIKDPLLILADEPTNDLDDYWANEVFNIFQEGTDKGKAVVLITHNEKWAKKANLRFTLDNGFLHKNSL